MTHTKRNWRVNSEGIGNGAKAVATIGGAFAVIAAGTAVGAWMTISGWMSDVGVSLDGLDLMPVERKALDLGQAEVVGPTQVAVQDGDLRHVFDFEARTVTTTYKIGGLRSFDELDSRRGPALLDRVIMTGCATAQLSPSVCAPVAP